MLILSAAVIVIGLACGSDKSVESGGFGEVNVVVGAGTWEDGSVLALESGPVPAEEIESFLLDVGRIVLNAEAEDDTSEADDDSTHDDSSNMVVIFDAEEQPEVDNEIDLIDLANLSGIISSAEVPVGLYSQIRLEIANPRLRFVDEELEDYLTNIQLTANGRMFAGVDLEISEGETVNLMLELNRIHLVEKGNGDFVLTPKLGVDVVSDL
jgi:hypothetical protein